MLAAGVVVLACVGFGGLRDGGAAGGARGRHAAAGGLPVRPPGRVGAGQRRPGLRLAAPVGLGRPQWHRGAARPGRCAALDGRDPAGVPALRPGAEPGRPGAAGGGGRRRGGPGRGPGRGGRPQLRDGHDLDRAGRGHVGAGDRGRPLRVHGGRGGGARDRARPAPAGERRLRPVVPRRHDRRGHGAGGGGRVAERPLRVRGQPGPAAGGQRGAQRLPVRPAHVRGPAAAGRDAERDRREADGAGSHQLGGGARGRRVRARAGGGVA